ncbi:MAG: hypothetical protein AAF921_07270 [Cyanobacteria bacterium P01_D01_bin.44]
MLKLSYPSPPTQLCQLNAVNFIDTVLSKLSADKAELRLLFLAIDSDTLLNQVATLLNPIHLDFSLRTHDLITDFQTIGLLGAHPETSHFQVSEADLSQTWQHILKLHDQLSETSVTGLIMASLTKIQDLIRETIDIETLGLRSWPLKPETISAISFAKSQPRPILQGLNIPIG